MSKIQAVVLAGGQGLRMRPYTSILPKPLLPIGDYPIAEVIIRQLKKAGIIRIAVSTGHLAGLIEAYFGNGKKWGVQISYVKEDEPLGTAGALKLVRLIGDQCLVINGDILTDLNFKKLIQEHKKKKAMATITVKERIVKTDFGVIELDSKNELSNYIEKPEHKSFVSMGVYVLNKECQKVIEDHEFLGMPELMLRLREKNKKVCCYTHKTIWLDLGRLDDFEISQKVFKKHKKKFLG